MLRRIKNRIWRYLREQDFHPTWGGVFFNPFFIARKGLKTSIAKLAPLLSGRLLDVGCGSKPYERLFRVYEYVGLDIDSHQSRSAGIADYFYDGKIFPFEDASFHSILCNQVLEHVFNPDDFLGEIYRILKPGGAILLTVPFVWDEHEQPYDYARYSSFGLKSLFEKQGFIVNKQEKISSNVSVIFQLINCYQFKLLPKSPRIRFIACITIMAPVTLLGLLLGKILPENKDLFLDQIIYAVKPDK